MSRLVRVFQELVAIPAPDGIEFMPETVKAGPIREDAFLWPVLVALGNGGTAWTLWTIDYDWR